MQEICFRLQPLDQLVGAGDVVTAQERADAPPHLLLLVGGQVESQLLVEVLRETREREVVQGLTGLQLVRASGQRRAGRSRTQSCCEAGFRSEEHTSELQSLMRISYAVFCLKKKK